MSGRNQKIGSWGENAAAKFLEERGYNVIARNVRTPYGEIDIIVEKDNLTIFVEVKTRTSTSLGPPEISVTARKQDHMLATAEHYAQENEIDHWQIDVIAVEGKPGAQPVFTHFENAI
jgi:putative endonuclease